MRASSFETGSRSHEEPPRCAHSGWTRHARRRPRFRYRQPVLHRQSAALSLPAVRQDPGHALRACLRPGHGGASEGGRGDREQSRAAHVREHDRRAGTERPPPHPGRDRIQCPGRRGHERCTKQAPQRILAEVRRPRRRDLPERQAVRASRCPVSEAQRPEAGRRGPAAASAITRTSCAPARSSPKETRKSSSA